MTFPRDKAEKSPSQQHVVSYNPKNADPFSQNRPFSAIFAQWVCTLAAAPPQVAASLPPIGGNCTTRGFDTPATRRQRASSSAKPPSPPAWRAPASPEGLAAVPVGGGGAWPGFETTRRAKLTARTARGRATAHGHTKQPGPTKHSRRPEHQRRQSNTATSTATTPRHTKNRHPDRMSACGGARGIRTPDLLIANETRYQLRHSPKDSNSLAPWRSATQADHDHVRDTTDRKKRSDSPVYATQLPNTTPRRYPTLRNAHEAR